MKIKLQSGQPYSLSGLLSGDNKIIIPDLQRDYTWGDKKHGTEKNIELVSGFCNSLFESYNEKEERELQLGMIYAYENPINHINIADGQQRLTTLFLLIGMLYQKTNNEGLKKRLISDFELKDDQEPYLQYAIRESTLYFLSDLTVNYFIGNYKGKIKDSKWYFSEYNNDPSIQSMINAIEIIEGILENKQNLTRFSNWLITEVKFLYFDMENRQHGEEMFVVINTTGEPLTATENLKPLLIGNITEKSERKTASDTWEKWEKWFWQNRLEKEHEADKGLNQFLVWYWQIKLRQENDWSTGKLEKLRPIKLFKERSVRENESKDSEFSAITKKDWERSIGLIEIDRYFEQFKVFWAYFKDDRFIKIFAQINNKTLNPRDFTQEQALDIILPMLEYMVKFPENEDLHYTFLRRLRKNYFDNKWNERNHNYVDWRHILEIIEKKDYVKDVLLFSDNDDNFKKIANVNSNVKNWYNAEEQIKTQLKKDNKAKIDEWEDHEDFMGDLSFLFKTVLLNESKEIPELTQTGVNIIDVEKIYINYKGTIDLIRKGGDTEKPQLSNLFRLFRLFIGCNKIEHIRYTSGIEGVLFSTINRNHLNKKEFMNLLKSNDLTFFCETYIKNTIKRKNTFDITGEKYTVKRFIKSWLSLKVFYANDKNILLSFRDKNGIAAYIDRDTNRLFSKFDFSLENSICGYGIKSGFGKGNYVRYTTEIGKWNKPKIIETTFSGVKFQDFKDDRNGTQDELDENRKVIDEIKKIILAD